jgi:tetratricopeptide (TPR) repeat protein
MKQYSAIHFAPFSHCSKEASVDIFLIIFYTGELLLHNIQMKSNESKILLDAIEYFKRALIDSKQPKTYYKLAEIYSKQNDFMKAIEMYENSLQ